ncbi:hypothetical protein ElyMa_001201800 [Elysia marginata]|uniref:Uncharacterized protein n=1 Tax=Elysia marginata TaxID=1093978 RepID=A0AAV4IA01_9GAST|nr:hypothetical protein ElyMa_001201800 [Elysia marginata]
MSKTYKIAMTDLCSCGETAENTERIQQDCQNSRTLRQAIWSSTTDLQIKLLATLEELEKTNSSTHQAYISKLSLLTYDSFGRNARQISFLKILITDNILDF